MKIVTEHEYKFGQQNVVPFLGLINISSEGIVEIEDGKESLAVELAGLGIGFSVLDENPVIIDSIDPVEEEEDLKKKSEDNDLGDKSEGDGLKPQTEDDTLNKIPVDSIGSTDVKDEVIGEEVKDVNVSTTFTKEEKEELLKIIEGLTFQEMRVFAKDNNYPESEWSQKRNGNQMMKYFEEKISSL